MVAKKLLVATRNQGKVVEFAQMLADLELGWFSLGDLEVTMDVAETGSTFRENALLKARVYAAETGLLTLADDSGLEVDALGGHPGVYTGRYGGEGLSHAERYGLLLRQLEDVSWEGRTARFRCVIVLVAADGALLGESEGTVEGVIATEPAGEGGFGYDPVFYLPEQGKTMAQLEPAEKHRISHRGRALRALEPQLRELLSQ